MPDQNPIYDFMKSNKLTDLDEKTFINKYSAPDKAKEIYSFMVENKLTDLDESKFYDKYLKKKVGGAESSLTELSSKGFSPEQINLLQTGAQPPKPVGKTGGTTIIPTNLTPDQKAYERELKRQGAAINTLKNIYSQKGLKFDEKSKRGQEQVLGLLEKERNNDLTLVTGKDQKPYLVRGEGFLESAGKGILRSITEPIESTKINFTNDPNELADLLDEKIKEEPNVPESAPTKFGGYLGGLAGGLPKMMALLAIPVAGESAMVGEMYHNALANQRRALYERGLQEGMDRPTAAMNAMKNAPITAIPDAIVGAAMARGIGGKAAGAEIIPNAAKESFLKATGNGLKGVAKVSGIGGAAEYGRSKVEQQLGYKVTDAEAIENGLRGMGEYAIMDAAFKLAHAGPKYLSSAAKNLLSTVPKEVLEVAAEKYPDGKQTLEDVAKFAETKAKVQDFVPEEKVGAVTGLTEKVQNLENNIKELEEKKKTSSQALHPFMDGWIKEYQDEIDFYKKQVDKVVKSKDPTGVSEEIDDITGLKAGQEPAVVEEKVEDITQFPETLKAKNKPIYDRNPTAEDGEFKIIGDPTKSTYRVNAVTGRVEMKGEDGSFSTQGTDTNSVLRTANVDGFQKVQAEVKPTEEKVASKEFFYIPVNGKIYKTNKTSAESNWAIKSINGEYIVDEVVGDNEYIIKRPESLVKPLFDEANVSSPDDKIFITKPAKLRKNADGTFDIVEKGEIYYGKEAPKAEVKPTEAKEAPLKENEYYHATDATEILAPSDKGYKKREGANVVGEGIYFGKDKEHLTDRYGKNAIKAELDIKNPLISNNKYIVVDGREIDVQSLSKEDINFLKQKGYDAIKYEAADRAYSNFDETIVFDKNQIKVKETIKNKENAIQEPSASSVLQYPQERVGETRGERKRVEPSIKGEKVTKEGKQTPINEKTEELTPYQKALKEKQEAEKKQTRQVAGEKAAASRRIFDRVFKMDAPEDAEQIALRYLADGGKVSKEAIDEAYGSVKRAQLNVKRRELLSEEVKSKDFVSGKETLNDVAHRLWEENGQRISERDIKKALMTEIGNNNTRLEAAEAYLDKYSAEYQLEKEEMRLAEQYREQYLEEQEEVEKELRKPLEEQIEGLGSEEHINNLIEQYEAEIKGEDQQLRSESEGKISAEAGKGEAVKEAPKGEEKLAQEYKEVIKKASKKAKENAKKDFVDRNFDKLVEKLKIQIKCPT